MRTLPALLIVIALCLMAVALPAAPAQAENEDDEPEPQIWLSPASGPPGTEVRVSGSGFERDRWVDIFFAGARTEAEEWTGDHGAFNATFTVPQIHGGPHRVEAVVGAVTIAEVNFTVRSALTASPKEGRVADTFTVTGEGFGRHETGIALFFGGRRIAEDIDITADFYGSWTETVRVPPSPGGSHTIDSPGAHDRPTFTVIPGIHLEEPSGSAGQAVGVTGSGFTAGERGIKIVFDGEMVPTDPEDVRADTRGSWEATFEVPEAPRGEYAVTAEGDRTDREDVGDWPFQMRTGIVLHPDEGHVGMNVTVTGSGFAVADEVVIAYDDSEVETATTDDIGSFELIFAVPRSRHGPREVRAEDTEGNEALAIFEMESDPPPVPEPVSPADGDRVGFTGRVSPRFEWSEVEDPSGVYYSVQISVSGNVTADGYFVDPLVSTEGLVAGNYKPDQRLGYGTYYWIVQAVDGAENESGWTEPQSFDVGRIPLWAFILIILAAVSLAGGAVYHFRVRTRMYD